MLWCLVSIVYASDATRQYELNANVMPSEFEHCTKHKAQLILKEMWVQADIWS